MIVEVSLIYAQLIIIFQICMKTLSSIAPVILILCKGKRFNLKKNGNLSTRVVTSS